MDEQTAADEFVRHMLSMTLRLVRLSGSNEPRAIASGFLTRVGTKYRVVSAGHAIGASQGWTIETLPVSARETLMLTVEGVQTVTTIQPNCQIGSLDISWADIDPQAIEEQLKNDPRRPTQPVELPLYVGPLDGQPSEGTSYGFAAWNRVEYHPDREAIHRDASFELHLAFEGIDPSGGLYRFRIARRHQGDEYYRGASGAPIADSEGRFISMLVCGDAAQNALYGVPLARHAPALQQLFPPTTLKPSTA
jgi:hypothetical protein